MLAKPISSFYSCKKRLPRLPYGRLAMTVSLIVIARSDSDKAISLVSFSKGQITNGFLSGALIMTEDVEVAKAFHWEASQ